MNFLILLIIPLCVWGGYRFEGFYPDCDGEKRVFLLSFFLPYNPHILAISDEGDIPARCERWMPKATVAYSDSVLPCDLLWIDNEKQALKIIQKAGETLPQVIYVATDLTEGNVHYFDLRHYLEFMGFSLLSHWYWEGQNGSAIFCRNDIFDATMRSLNYHPNNHRILTSAPIHLEPFFKPALNKSSEHAFGTIDYIYMINLDERPEKFSLASTELQWQGINPYRFSAVNGWQLPFSALNQIGLKLEKPVPQEPFRGTVFREEEGKIYISNELIQEMGTNYFSLGLSRGAIGIVLSHLSVLQDAYNSGYTTIWVMEDDVEAVSDPHALPQLIAHLDQLDPQWDILFTDKDTKDTQGKYVSCRSLAARPNYPMEPLNSYLHRMGPINEEFSLVSMRYGAYSMIIRRSGMKKILDFYKTYGIFLPYDMDYWLIPDLTMYCVNKDIVTHRVHALSDNGEPNYLKK